MAIKNDNNIAYLGDQHSILENQKEKKPPTRTKSCKGFFRSDILYIAK